MAKFDRFLKAFLIFGLSNLRAIIRRRFLIIVNRTKDVKEIEGRRKKAILFLSECLGFVLAIEAVVRLRFFVILGNNLTNV